MLVQTCASHHSEGARHSCAYVEAVNRLIPVATRSAKQRFDDHLRDHGAPDKPGELWSTLFLEEMQIECEVIGLRRPGPRYRPIIVQGPPSC